ncbi:MAG: hypothetical protein ABSB57_02020 [Dehalococcoidia bacterium]
MLRRALLGIAAIAVVVLAGCGGKQEGQIAPAASPQVSSTVVAVAADVGCGITAKRADQVPELPGGLVALSPLYELSVPSGAEEQGCRWTTISLDTPTQDASNLAFYTFSDGTWVRLAAATLANDGAAAESELEKIPDNLRVLRLSEQ